MDSAGWMVAFAGASFKPPACAATAVALRSGAQHRIAVGRKVGSADQWRVSSLPLACECGLCGTLDHTVSARAQGGFEDLYSPTGFSGESVRVQRFTPIADVLERMALGCPKCGRPGRIGYHM